jgi:hypothetical protein
VATNTAGGITMKLATAIKTLEQQFGLTDVQYSKNDYGTHRPYSFYALTDDYYIRVLDANNSRSLTNFLQHPHEFFAADVDNLINRRRICVAISPRSHVGDAKEYFIDSFFTVNRGDVDFIKNLLSPIE